MSAREPQLLSQAIAELIAVRGFARTRAASDLERFWNETSGEKWSPATKPLRITRGVLHVEVQSSALLGQLTAFHGPELTTRFQQIAPHLKVKSIKFRLKGC